MMSLSTIQKLISESKIKWQYHYAPNGKPFLLGAYKGRTVTIYYFPTRLEYFLAKYSENYVEGIFFRKYEAMMEWLYRSH